MSRLLLAHFKVWTLASIKPLYLKRQRHLLIYTHLSVESFSCGKSEAAVLLKAFLCLSKKCLLHKLSHFSVITYSTTGCHTLVRFKEIRVSDHNMLWFSPPVGRRSSLCHLMFQRTVSSSHRLLCHIYFGAQSKADSYVFKCDSLLHKQK